MTDDSVPLSRNPVVVVAGDVTIDWVEVTTPATEAPNQDPNSIQNWRTYPGTRFVSHDGGALLLAKFMRAAPDLDVRSPGSIVPTPPQDTSFVHSFVTVDRFPRTNSAADKKNLVYRISSPKGFSGPREGRAPSRAILRDTSEAEVVVVDDAGSGFAADADVWPCALAPGRTPVVVLKLFRPIPSRRLWDHLRKHHADRLILVIDADDLRRIGVNMSRRLSWERTAKELVWQLACNPALVELGDCSYLIVRFGLEGVILNTRRAGRVETELFFDPKLAEDEFNEHCPGKMMGGSSAFVASLARTLAQSGISRIREAVPVAMRAPRRLYLEGYGKSVESLDYPVGEIMGPAAPGDPHIARVPVPQPTMPAPADPDYWCILGEQVRGRLEDVAFNTVLLGADAGLDNVPVGQFGFLKTVDRTEIEAFRSIRNLIREYLDNRKNQRPLSIAVFGPPGSGKSFGVEQVAKSVASDQLAEKVEFNLSQFTSLRELIQAFHRVRDIALTGKVPFVFFDEFDSAFETRLGWLRYFLSPMQDGKFREEGTEHPIGRAIFVFAGGTASSLAQFCDESAAGVGPSFREVKGPDFVSRLKGYVNVLGPDKLGEDDQTYLLRRATLLRSMFDRKTPHLIGRNGNLRIDVGVLRALMKIDRYKHGTRSMEAIIDMSMLAGRTSFEQAALPPAKQLRLHVDDELFGQLLARDVLLSGMRETLARAIHEKYLQDQKGKKPDSDSSMRPWEELDEALRESNRQQADHIPVKLRAVGCGFTPVVGRKPEVIDIFTSAEKETLSRLEHARFVTERFLHGWSYGTERSVKERTSPYLVAWDKLEESVKQWDRDVVEALPTILAMAGFEIYRM